MINAHFYQDHNQRFYAFRLEGHADSAAHGYDLVCAGVTALASSCIASVLYILDIEAEYELLEGCACLKLPKELELTEREREDLDLLIRSLHLGLQQINENYENRYLRIVSEVTELGGHEHVEV
ncbi:MAG: ribosomal-processing cysteine protease Prp [Eubacteriales bacterium]|nr:ribosomal-processing cysteine protease Prp [Eubacteriales bacterium]